MRTKAITRCPPGDYDDAGDAVWTPSLDGNSGSAGGVNSMGRDRDVVRELREVVAEVTRGRIPAPAPRKAGFY